jgi:hypothetical protein
LHWNLAPAAGVALKVNLAVVEFEDFFGRLVILTFGGLGRIGGFDELGPEEDEEPLPAACSSGLTGSAVAALGSETSEVAPSVLVSVVATSVPTGTVA